MISFPIKTMIFFFKRCQTPNFFGIPPDARLFSESRWTLIFFSNPDERLIFFRILPDAPNPLLWTNCTRISAKGSVEGAERLILST